MVTSDLLPFHLRNQSETLNRLTSCTASLPTSLLPFLLFLSIPLWVSNSPSLLASPFPSLPFLLLFLYCSALARAWGRDWETGDLGRFGPPRAHSLEPNPSPKCKVDWTEQRFLSPQTGVMFPFWSLTSGRPWALSLLLAYLEG
jgi:hypothetical protein